MIDENKERMLAHSAATRMLQRSPPVEPMEDHELASAHRECRDYDESLRSYIPSTKHSIGYKRKMMATILFNRMRRSQIEGEMQKRRRALPY